MRKIPRKKSKVLRQYIEFLKALAENKKLTVGTVLYTSPHKILLPNNKFNKLSMAAFLNNLAQAKILTMKKRGEYLVTERFCNHTANQIVNYVRHTMSTKRRDRKIKNGKLLQSMLAKTRTSGRRVNFSSSDSVATNKEKAFKMLENIPASLILEYLQGSASRARRARIAIEEEMKAIEDVLKKFQHQQLKLSF